LPASRRSGSFGEDERRPRVIAAADATTTSGGPDVRRQASLPLSVLTLAGLAAACGGGSSGPGTEKFTVTLNGGNEVPVVSTSATGSATFTLVGDTAIAYTITLNNINQVIMAHIHSGDAGVASGPLLVSFFTDTAGVTPPNGVFVTGRFNASNIVLGGVSLDSIRKLARLQHAYVQVHTKGNPLGEVRGQLAP
jgi:hypothetical protein